MRPNVRMEFRQLQGYGEEGERALGEGGGEGEERGYTVGRGRKRACGQRRNGWWDMDWDGTNRMAWEMGPLIHAPDQIEVVRFEGHIKSVGHLESRRVQVV